MSTETTYNRRQFLNNAFVAFGAAQVAMPSADGKHFIDQNLCPYFYE